jgi:SAM-dependent methyltransferase
MASELQPHEVIAAEEARITDQYARWHAWPNWFAPGELFMQQEFERHIVTLLGRHGGTKVLEGKQILEVGCGKGYWLRQLVKWGASPEQVAGIDLVAGHVAEAKRLAPPGMRVEQASATSLPFPDASCDLVLQMVIFTSILDSRVRAQAAREMLRVLKPDGLILWLDFRVNNPRNPDVRGVKKAEIRQLFPGCRVDLRRVCLAPPLIRRLSPYSWLLCYLLAKVPFLCTHYLGTIRKT